MSITITSRHFKAHETLNAYAADAVEHLGKYYDGIIKAEVILSYERARNSRKIAEVNLAVHDAVLTGRWESDDFFKSIDVAVEKLRARLRKYKDKRHLRDREQVRRVRAKS